MDPSDYGHSQGYYDHPEGYQDEEPQEFPEAPEENQKQPAKKNDEEEEKTTANEEEEPATTVEEIVTKNNRRRRLGLDDKDKENDFTTFASLETEPKITDPVILAQVELIEKSTPTTDLEIALSNALKRKQTHIDRLTNEIIKLKQFISKRKQTYKRKRKDDGAPTRALSAYNIFIQDRFASLAKENAQALTSEDKDAKLKRVPPSSLVSSTGNEWKTLSDEVKAQYEERYVIMFFISFEAPHEMNLILFLSFFNRNAGPKPIASATKSKWRNTSLPTSNRIASAIRRATTCSSRPMCSVLNRLKVVFHLNAVPSLASSELPGSSSLPKRKRSTNVKPTSTTV